MGLTLKEFKQHLNGLSYPALKQKYNDYIKQQNLKDDNVLSDEQEYFIIDTYLEWCRYIDVYEWFKPLIGKMINENAEVDDIHSAIVALYYASKLSLELHHDLYRTWNKNIFLLLKKCTMQHYEILVLLNKHNLLYFKFVEKILGGSNPEPIYSAIKLLAQMKVIDSNIIMNLFENPQRMHDILQLLCCGENTSLVTANNILDLWSVEPFDEIKALITQHKENNNLEVYLKLVRVASKYKRLPYLIALESIIGDQPEAMAWEAILEPMPASQQSSTQATYSSNDERRMALSRLVSEKPMRHLSPENNDKIAKGHAKNMRNNIAGLLIRMNCLTPSLGDFIASEKFNENFVKIIFYLTLAHLLTRTTLSLAYLNAEDGSRLLKLIEGIYLYDFYKYKEVGKVIFHGKTIGFLRSDRPIDEQNIIRLFAISYLVIKKINLSVFTQNKSNEILLDALIVFLYNRDLLTQEKLLAKINQLQRLALHQGNSQQTARLCQFLLKDNVNLSNNEAEKQFTELLNTAQNVSVSSGFFPRGLTDSSQTNPTITHLNL